MEPIQVSVHIDRGEDINSTLHLLHLIFNNSSSCKRLRSLLKIAQWPSYEYGNDPASKKRAFQDLEYRDDSGCRTRLPKASTGINLTSLTMRI
jgi:hypothetical protein